LHLVGILFPHINDDALSKSHQTRKKSYVTAEIRKGNSQNISDEPYRIKQLAWYYVLDARQKEATPTV
jgi:hypothetical protein